MKRILPIFVLILCVASITSCKSSSKNTMQTSGDNSRTSLDWDGIYRGVIPCADCEGIQTTVYLNRDESYKLVLKYLGKQDEAREYTGKFSWNKEGNTITLDDAVTGSRYRYLVGENTLTQLDQQGNKISGELAGKYILSKENYSILEKYWKLVELNGQPVIVDSTFRKEPHLIFKDADKRFNGWAGCNTVSGTFEIGSMNSIRFSQVVSTRMACPQMQLESQFVKVLESADNYTITGDELVLNKAKMAPLARFKTVYMQ